MQINDKAYNAFLTMFGDIDFSKSGYRPPLDEPLIFATLSGKTINILSKMGYEMRSNTLLASTQKQLLHGMRIKKQKAGCSFTKDDFLEFPKHICLENLYMGINARAEKEIRFFWDIGLEKAKYVYFNLSGELGTYGITNIEMVKISKKLEC